MAPGIRSWFWRTKVCARSRVATDGGTASTYGWGRFSPELGDVSGSGKLRIAPALNGETVAIEDTATDDRIQYKSETQKEGIVSMLCVPIKVREKVIGVMRLCSGVKRDFPEDIVTLVSAVAHQGGLAIQNASMYLKLQSDKESLEKDIWSHRQWF